MYLLWPETLSRDQNDQNWWLLQQRHPRFQELALIPLLDLLTKANHVAAQLVPDSSIGGSTHELRTELHLRRLLTVSHTATQTIIPYH